MLLGSDVVRERCGASTISAAPFLFYRCVHLLVCALEFSILFCARLRHVRHLVLRKLRKLRRWGSARRRACRSVIK